MLRPASILLRLGMLQFRFPKTAASASRAYDSSLTVLPAKAASDFAISGTRSLVNRLGAIYTCSFKLADLSSSSFLSDAIISDLWSVTTFHVANAATSPNAPAAIKPPLSIISFPAMERQKPKSFVRSLMTLPMASLFYVPRCFSEMPGEIDARVQTY